MTKITESEIEQFAIELLEAQGYSYTYGPAIATKGKSNESPYFA
ncbi:MAG: hypothetical protein U9N86_10670 [Bacteroidota bacterium]|nr:hypothetical protein [Bacteroidota bacterium]